jgi:toxin FitB
LKFLLDTNVVSELSRSQPHPNVIDWLKSISEIDISLSVISIIEMRFGVEILPAGKRKRDLSEWLAVTFSQRFSERILPVSESIADRAGRFLALARGRGQTIEVADVLIASTAVVHSLTVVTRNTRHFALPGLSLVDPWQSSNRVR